MKRCTRVRSLEVHHISISGGAGVSNARVLCSPCHEATKTYGDTAHKSPPDFSEEVKEKAMRHAGHRCECRRGGKCCQN